MPSSLTVPHPWSTGAWILIEDEALEVVARHRQIAGEASEAGGILLGYRRGNHIQVTQATSPQPGDKRSRFSFDRIDRAHALFAGRRWKHSNGRCDYLGEWHTHPEQVPTPSGIDNREWRKLYQSSARPLIFWIEGTEARWIGLGHKCRLSCLEDDLA